MIMRNSEHRPESTAYDERDDRIAPELATPRRGRRLTDRRTTLGRAWHEWRRALIADLGGPAALSIQQLALVDLAANTKVLIEALDRRLLADPVLLEGGRCRNVVVLRERDRLATTFALYITTLGLQRQRASETTPARGPDEPTGPVAVGDDQARRALTGPRGAASGAADGDR
jgi:hypothetical protein